MTYRHFLLCVSALSLFLYARAGEEHADQGLNYQMTEQGYMTLPRQTAAGIVLSNNRHSELYLLRDGRLETLVRSRGCGRYTSLNADGALLGYKSIADDGRQAPAVLDVTTGETVLLEDYAEQCGQVSFSRDGSVAYTTSDGLTILRGADKTHYPLGFYTNIAALSPDGRTVALSNADGQPCVMALADGRLTRLSDQPDMFNPKWSPDGKKAVFECDDNRMYVFDLPSGRMYCLGNGFEPVWLNGNEIVYSRSEYRNGDVFAFEGISVRMSVFDGTRQRILLPASMECPQEVGVLNDGRLAVCYAYGKRRLAAIRLDRPQDDEEVLYVLPEQESSFGYVHSNLKETELLQSAAPVTRRNKIKGHIGILDIPYINQVHDVPDSYQNCHTYGPVACAPSTACMLLGYYGLLDPHAVTSRKNNCPWGKTNYFSWYVGQEYVSRSGYRFNIAAEGQGCYAKGGYGFMWNGSSSPSSSMHNFYTYNAVTKATREGGGTARIRSECSADRPYSWCVTSTRTNGHLILPFLADAKCVKINGAWVVQDLTGSVVVQDPYGDANNATWAGSDGRYSTYDLSGYNNGYLKMVNAWGVAVVAPQPVTNHVEYELNGGDWPIGIAVRQPADNATLWEMFKPEYNQYYKLSRADQPIDKVSTFASAYMADFMTDTASAWHWLGLYVDSVALSQNYTLNTEQLWRWAVHAFFNCSAAGSLAVATPDFTAAGKPVAWKYAWDSAPCHQGKVVPPDPVTSTYTLPIPVRSDYTFDGWFWSATFDGNPVTTVDETSDGTLHAKWTYIPSALPNILRDNGNTAVKIMRQGRLFILRNGQLYDATGRKEK